MAESVAKMAFGNKLGVKIEHNVDPRDFFAAAWGRYQSAKCRMEWWDELSISYTVIGEVTDRAFEYGKCGHHHGRGALDAWMTPPGECVPLPRPGGKRIGGALEGLFDHSGAVYVCRP